MAAKKKTKTIEPAPGTEAAPQANAGPTLKDVAEGYLAAIEKDDAGAGTLASYRMELRLALRELGETLPLADLTATQVQAYFESEAVMRTKTGKPKAQPTWAKTRRVLRLALLWAQDAGLVEVAPVPAPPVKAVPADVA
jgi:hypothetical protein